MSSKLTQEFSICLLPDQAATDAMTTLRQQLAPSPYRDDMPHITLLRGITTLDTPSDNALRDQIGRLLHIDADLPLQMSIQDITNRSNHLYSSSSMLLLQSEQYAKLHDRTLQRLNESDMTVEEVERRHYMPHFTVRLGIPFESETLEKAQEIFADGKVTFTRWVLFRLVLDGDKRQMHVVSDA